MVIASGCLLAGWIRHDLATRKKSESRPTVKLVRAAYSEQQRQEPKTQAQANPHGPRPRIYNSSADPKVDVEKASARAKKENKHVLLMFGFESCGWCHKLHELFASNPQINKTLANEYVLVMIDIRSPAAEPLLERCKAGLNDDERKRPFGYPFLAVLDAEGKLKKAQPTDVLEEGDHHDPQKVLEFLSHFKPAPQDGKAVLEEALSRSSSADKRVFLIFGAPWCGWCHRLEDWLAEPEVAAIMDHDFVVTKIDIDRMMGGKDVMMQFRKSESGGIPWYVILDPQGKSLATADGPEGNIGYPFKPKEIDHFLTTVKGTCRKIDAQQIEKLQQSLTLAAQRIAKRRGVEKKFDPNRDSVSR
jgi:thioredoxin-related protein